MAAAKPESGRRIYEKTGWWRHRWLHGRMIYEEIQRISENSKVRLQGRTRAVQMLKIEMQHDSGEAAGQRMTEYIEECIKRVREQTVLVVIFHRAFETVTATNFAVRATLWR